VGESCKSECKRKLAPPVLSTDARTCYADTRVLDSRSGTDCYSVLNRYTFLYFSHVPVIVLAVTLSTRVAQHHAADSCVKASPSCIHYVSGHSIALLHTLYTPHTCLGLLVGCEGTLQLPQSWVWRVCSILMCAQAL